MAMQADDGRWQGSDPATQLRPADGRMPPSDLAAEAAVLSAVLLTDDAFDRVHELLAPEHFYALSNRHIYEAVAALNEKGQPADFVTVRSWLKDKGRLDQVGGTAYLVQLTDAVPSVAHVETYAETIHSKWRLRQLIATCQRHAAEGYGDCGDVQQFVDRTEQSIYEIARTEDRSAVEPLKKALVNAFNIITEAQQRGGQVSGIATGFHDLDRRCAGLQKGELYIVAGRPGMGKTAFVLNVAVNVASPEHETPDPDDPYASPVERPGYGVAVFSLEMPREQLASRMLASEARVDASRIRSGNVSPDDWNKLTEAATRLGRLPIWVDDTPGLTLMDLRARVRRLKAELDRGSDETPAQRLGLVVIDYLQLMQGRKDASTREQEISELSRGLKQLSKELGVSVLALSQLNRAVETRGTKDKRPQLSDLRESGAIEQDADAIVFIYRDDYYFDDSDSRGQAELIIAKQRNGPTGKVDVRFTKEYTRFDNLAREEYDFDAMDDFDPGANAAF